MYDYTGIEDRRARLLELRGAKLDPFKNSLLILEHA
jgi:hypothetical protein